jgi:hypothetical protein
MTPDSTVELRLADVRAALDEGRRLEGEAALARGQAVLDRLHGRACAACPAPCPSWLSGGGACAGGREG